MPSLAVAIDPENRTAQDAQRVSGNISKVANSAVATATSLLDVVRSAQRLSDGTASLVDLGFAATQAQQAVVLLSRSFGLSTLGSVGVVAGVAAASYAVFSARSRELTQEQQRAKDAVDRLAISHKDGAEAFDGFVTAQRGIRLSAIVGDTDIQVAALNEMRGAILDIIDARERGFDLTNEQSSILGGRSDGQSETEALVGLYRSYAQEVENLGQNFDDYNKIVNDLRLNIDTINLSDVERTYEAFSRSGVRIPENTVGGETFANTEIIDLLETLDQQAKLKQLSDDMSFAIVDPIEQAILKGGELEDVLANIGQAIQAAFLRNVIANPIAESLSQSLFGLFGGFNLFGQHGLAISGGAVTGLAHGGLLTQPTYMGAGVVAREAGRDEFVMPATRVGQDLGVKAIADPNTAAELGQQTALLRQLVALASGGGNSFGMSSRQSGRRF